MPKDKKQAESPAEEIQQVVMPVDLRDLPQPLRDAEKAIADQFSINPDLLMFVGPPQPATAVDSNIFAQVPIKPIEPEVPAKLPSPAELGDDGFIRMGHSGTDIRPAKICDHYKTKKPDGSIDHTYSVVFWGERTNGYQGHKDKVTVGKGAFQFWHSLQELKVAIAIERESRKNPTAS